MFRAKKIAKKFWFRLFASFYYRLTETVSVDMFFIYVRYIVYEDISKTFNIPGLKKKNFSSTTPLKII